MPHYHRVAIGCQNGSRKSDKLEKFPETVLPNGGPFASPALESTRLFVTGNSGISDTFVEDFVLLIRQKNSGDTNRSVIIVDAGIHAREWIAPAMALNIIHRAEVARQFSDAMWRRNRWVVADHWPAFKAMARAIWNKMQDDSSNADSAPEFSSTQDEIEDEQLQHDQEDDPTRAAASGRNDNSFRVVGSGAFSNGLTSVTIDGHTYQLNLSDPVTLSWVQYYMDLFGYERPWDTL
nr:hypothetical protein BaRGS_004656 [Batillaria attramentaria]